MENDKIINGFCYLKENSVIFIDLVTEKSEEYKKDSFKKFISENDIDEYCLFLANRECNIVTPLFKYKLQSTKTKNPVKANQRTLESLIKVCYKICIQLLSKSRD